MGRPSNDWTGLGGERVGPETTKLLEHLLSTANFDYLKTQAIKTRKSREPDPEFDVTCSIELTRFAIGHFNAVFEIGFSDGIYWVARVLYRQNATDTSEELADSALSEITTMQYVRSRTTIPVPQVFAYELSTEQPFGHAYVLMECMPGRMLENGLALSTPAEHHSKLAKQFADILNQLQSLTFDRIGRLWPGESIDEPPSIRPVSRHASSTPFETSLEYFYNIRQSANRKMLDLFPDDPDRRTAAWVLKGAVNHIILEDRVRGPFPLCHHDLHYANILIDENFNITGVIDWSEVQTAPLEQLGICCEIRTFPGRDDDFNRPIVEFGKLVIDSLKRLEQEAQPAQLLTSLSTFMPSKSAEIAYFCERCGPRIAHLVARHEVAGLIYGKALTWEQLRAVYGNMLYF